MNMEKVVSSNVHSVGHDPATNNLHIQFKSGETYVYHGVSPEKHQALISAPSIGAHLNAHVKPHHKFKKL